MTSARAQAKTGFGHPRWFLSIALGIVIAHDFNFASSARSHQRLRVQDIRDFPQAELGMEINARFLLNKQDDPHFLLLELKLHRAIYHLNRFKKEFELLLQNSLILML